MHLCNGPTAVHLATLLASYGLTLVCVAEEVAIAGSHWGEPEAGLVGRIVYARTDTPVHSVLHEASHVVCMDNARRAMLRADAGGDHAEEDAVCFLQIVLAARIGLSTRDICADMDAWGYTFRLGSAWNWYTHDADEARDWLVRNGLLTATDEPTFCLRMV